MTLVRYLITMAILTLVCWACFIYVIFTINPQSTNLLGLVFFYVSLFLSLVGTAAIAGFLARFVVLKKALAFRLVKEAFRQSFLFAALIVVSLLLLSQDLFTWINILFLVIGLTVVELFLLSYEKK